MSDESWPMVESAVMRLFTEAAERGGHVTIGPRLAEMGWSDIEAEYPDEACRLLFRAQGRSLAHTDCLARVMLAELGLTGSVDGVVLPGLADGCTPGTSDDRVCGIVLGPAEGRLAVPISGPAGTSVVVVDAVGLEGERMDTFDTSVHWTRISGHFDGTPAEASVGWCRAMTAAHRTLATELVALADEALRIAVEHAKVRVQFGEAIGSFQSPRHALAVAAAQVEGARALVDESWRDSGQLSAQAAKAAAGRAHRVVSDTALQICGAIGLTSDHDLHRYIARGFLLDALCGSHQQLEASIAARLFDISEDVLFAPQYF